MTPAKLLSQKICHIITGLHVGGAERSLFRLLASPLAKRFTHSVISLGGMDHFGPKLQQLPIEVYCLGLRPAPTTIFAASSLAKIVAQLEPDVIQGWMYHGNLAAYFAHLFSARQARLMWNIRQCLYDIRKERPLTRQVIRANAMLSRRPCSIIYNSHTAKIQHEAAGFCSSSGVVIPNGFDLDEYAPNSVNGLAVRELFGVRPASFVFGHVARFHPMKDHATFIRAAVITARQHSACQFVMAGRGVTFENEALRGLIPDDVRDRFVLLDEQSDVTSLLRTFDVLVSSSAWGEAFSNVIGEAMASGVPCIATDVGDSRQIVGDAGFIVPPRSADNLAEMMISCARDPGITAQLGKDARMRITSDYQITATIQAYENQYARCHVERST